MLRTPQFFNILTWKCTSRHSGVQFFDIVTSKSGPKLTCFVHFHLAMYFSPQRRAIFQHLNFKKWSENVSFLAFSLQNVLLATAACNFSTSQLQKVFCVCFLCVFSLCVFCVFSLCVFLSVFSVCVFCVFSVWFLSVFSLCVFCLCFLSVFSLCVFSVFSVCVFCLCVFCLCVLSVFSLCVFCLCFLSVFSVYVFCLCFLCMLSVCVFCLCFLSGFAFYRTTKNDTCLSINFIILLWSGLADQLLFADINTIKGWWSANSQLISLQYKYKTLTRYFGLSGYPASSFFSSL